jgi:hypothetical protein
MFVANVSCSRLVHDAYSQVLVRLVNTCNTATLDAPLTYLEDCWKCFPKHVENFRNAVTGTDTADCCGFELRPEPEIFSNRLD